MAFSICGTVGANVGAIDCDVQRGRPLGIALGSAVFTSSDYASSAAFKTAFIAKTKKAAGSIDKLFAFPEIQAITDKTDAPKEGTFGYGLKTILLEGKPGYELQMIPGTSLEKQMRKFHRKTVPVFVFDDASNVWGVSDSSGNFSGAKCLISVIGKGFEDGNNTKSTLVQISFVSSSDFYDNAAFATSTMTIGDLKGLLDVTLSEYAAHASNVYKVQGKIPTAQMGTTLNLADYFTTVLNSSALWVAYSGATYSTTMPITSVAYNAGNKGWDVTLDTTTYGALSASTPIKIGLADPTTLDTAGVTGVESIAVLTIK